MTEKTQNAINMQIKEELYSSYLYLAMSAYAQAKNLSGVANWFYVQAKEEIDHAMGFYNYLLERGGEVELQEIAKPPKKFESVTSLFEEGLKHEQHITGTINALYVLATEEKDYAFQSFLKWYIEEQVEEEANATEIIEKIKLVGDSGPVLYMLDKELSGRQYTPTSPTAK